MLVFQILVIVLLLVLVLYLATVFFYLLGQNNLFFTYVKEGEIKAIMRGSELDHFVERVSGWHFKDPYNPDPHKRDWEMVEDKEKPKDNRWWLWKRLGIYPVGLPPHMSVLLYELSWNTSNLDLQKHSYTITSRKERVDSILFRHAYPVLVKDAEGADKVAYNLVLLITLQVTNPDRALFKTSPPGRYMVNSIAAIESAARAYMSMIILEDMLTKKAATLNPSQVGKKDVKPEIVEGLVNAVKSINSKAETFTTDDINVNFGLEVWVVNFQELQIANPELVTAMHAEKIAEYNADAAIKTAEGDKKATILRSEGKATEIRNLGRAETESIKKRYAAAATQAGGMAVLQTEVLTNGLAAAPNFQTFAPGSGALPTILLNSNGQPIQPVTTPTATSKKKVGKNEEEEEEETEDDDKEEKE